MNSSPWTTFLEKHPVILQALEFFKEVETSTGLYLLGSAFGWTKTGEFILYSSQYTAVADLYPELRVVSSPNPQALRGRSYSSHYQEIHLGWSRNCLSENDVAYSLLYCQPADYDPGLARFGVIYNDLPFQEGIITRPTVNHCDHRSPDIGLSMFVSALPAPPIAQKLSYEL